MHKEALQIRERTWIAFEINFPYQTTIPFKVIKQIAKKNLYITNVETKYIQNFDINYYYISKYYQNSNRKKILYFIN